jgi:sialate O-acetylesterase
MIAPLRHFAVRGVIWYQGESNAGRAWEYRTLFPTMIQSWRETWGQPVMPFLFVQLANYQARLDEPGESDWAELREAQLLTLKLPHTGMAVSIDIGNADDIHPRNKEEVGRRLYLAALAQVYGRDLEHSGPLYTGIEIEGDRIRVRFDHAEGLMLRGGAPLVGFAIAGADRTFRWAEAEVDGDSVVVHHPEVKEPVAVRYAWADNPACNLQDGAGLPASPFRSDDWPGLTGPPAE